jgi:enoyl-CoA hydratase
MSVHVEVDGGVIVVTIERPEARNAVNGAVAHGIAAAMDRLDSDPSLRAGVLTGGGGYFSSGMDLKAFVAGEPVRVEGRGFAGLVERPPGKPLIAAVEGFALAGGFEVALACDLIVAASDARFGIPEAKRSLVAGGGALMRLPRRAALEMGLTGEPISAERAYQLGLVSRLSEPGQALGEARRMADAIAANGPLAVAATKRIIDAGWTEDQFWQRQGEVIGPVFASEDAREGAVAFAEKRDPVWRGR